MSDKIYDLGRAKLGSLLAEAGVATAATLLVPSLQRPFVWSPIQVIRLVDTLLRGWPFGTLLFWKIDQKANDAQIPSRPFWAEEDRTAEGNSTPQQYQDAPANYRMVLDGQQRLQSLLLAVGGGRHGFKLTDRDWFQGLTDADTRRGRWSDKHWSRGSLFIDLPEYTAQYLIKDNNPRNVDYESCLKWVSPEHSDRSLTKRSPNYLHPLQLRTEHSGRFVRFSRLWELAEPGRTASQLRDRVSSLLDQYQTPSETRRDDAEAVAELVVQLAAVKAGDVSYLELQPYSTVLGSIDDYNDAVVNIFTRLNKGGRALTDQEISYAWIKANWDLTKTSGLQADQCFDSLRGKLAGLGLGLTEDDVVRTTSVCWSAICDNGLLLGKGDMLRPAKVKRLATELCNRWDRIAASACDTATVLKEADLEYGTQYDSLSAAMVLIAWRVVGAEWVASHSLNVTQKDALAKQLDAGLKRECIRWFAVTEWGEAWSGSAGRQFKGMIEDLSHLHKAISTEINPSIVAERLIDALSGWLTPLIATATDTINRLQAPDRNQVVRYYLPLWIWHRLGSLRYDESRILLRDATRRAKPVFDVDHIVPFSWCESQFKLLPETEQESRKSGGNEIGNCWLMWTNFNKSKSADTLAQFLARVHDFRTDGGKSVTVWATPLGISTPLLNATAFSLDDVIQAIKDRSKMVKDDLKAFIRGEMYPVG